MTECKQCSRDPSTFEELIAMLPKRVSPPTIRSWIAAGHFPSPVRLGPRTRFWRRADVLAWIEACEHGTTGAQ